MLYLNSDLLISDESILSHDETTKLIRIYTRLPSIDTLSKLVKDKIVDGNLDTLRDILGFVYYDLKTGDWAKDESNLQRLFLIDPRMVLLKPKQSFCTDCSNILDIIDNVTT